MYIISILQGQIGQINCYAVKFSQLKFVKWRAHLLLPSYFSPFVSALVSEIVVQSHIFSRNRKLAHDGEKTSSVFLFHCKATWKICWVKERKDPHFCWPWEWNGRSIPKVSLTVVMTHRDCQIRKKEKESCLQKVSLVEMPWSWFIAVVEWEKSINTTLILLSNK